MQSVTQGWPDRVNDCLMDSIGDKRNDMESKIIKKSLNILKDTSVQDDLPIETD